MKKEDMLLINHISSLGFSNLHNVAFDWKG